MALITGWNLNIKYCQEHEMNKWWCWCGGWWWGRKEHNNGASKKQRKREENGGKSKSNRMWIWSFLIHTRALSCVCGVSDLLQIWFLYRHLLTKSKPFSTYRREFPWFSCKIDRDVDKPGIYLISESMCLSTYQCSCEWVCVPSCQCCGTVKKIHGTFERCCTQLLANISARSSQQFCFVFRLHVRVRFFSGCHLLPFHLFVGVVGVFFLFH